MKPRSGFAKDIYEIVAQDGPLAYNGIHRRLRERKIRASAKQVKKALTNMQTRNQLARAEHCKTKFVVPNLESNQTAALKADPIPSPSPMQKTPERDDIRPTEGLFGMNLKDSAIVILIAVVTSALTTTLLEQL